MKAVVFDCFGVLYADPSQLFFEREIMNYQQLRPELLALNAQIDYGLISRQQWVEQVAELASLPVEKVAKSIDATHIKNHELIEYIDELRGRGYLVAMCSNIGPGGMDRFFSLEERSQLFDVVVLSGEEMVTKPSPVIFELVAQRLGVGTGECIMIDDNQDNCAGADAAGMRAVYYQTNQQALTEVEQILA